MRVEFAYVISSTSGRCQVCNERTEMVLRKIVDGKPQKGKRLCPRHYEQKRLDSWLNTVAEEVDTA